MLKLPFLGVGGKAAGTGAGAGKAAKGMDTPKDTVTAVEEARDGVVAAEEDTAAAGRENRLSSLSTESFTRSSESVHVFHKSLIEQHV